MIEHVDDTLHGVTIRDPFRWLEDRSSSATDAWIQDQQDRCRRYFEKHDAMAALAERVRDYLNIETVDQPARVGDRYFYRKRDIGQEQGSIRTHSTEDSTERILIDPADEGPFISVGIYRISMDGQYLAYETAPDGRDQKEIRILHVPSGRTLDDRISKGYRRGFHFVSDGYFYCHDSQHVSEDHLIRRHLFGSKEEDKVVLRIPRTASSRVLLFGNQHRLAVICTRKQNSALVADFYVSGVNDGLTWHPVVQNKRLPFLPLLWKDRILAFEDASPGKPHLIEISSRGSELREIIPPQEATIRAFAIFRDQFFVSSFAYGSTRIERWFYSGERKDSIILPVQGTIRLIPPAHENSEGFFYSYESYSVPLTLYEYDARTLTSTIWHSRVPAAQIGDRRVQELEFSSKDGTTIPLTLISAKSQRGVTPSPIIMAGYGGFGASMAPQFSVLGAVLMELGVTLALPHIRGGGEFGKAWHDAGRREHRQNAFDDFLAAADWLCREGLTTPNRLGIFGGSNGGLLVAAAMTQRPDLFRAVLCIAPLLDMLRYEHFDRAAHWQEEYGSVENARDFEVLHRYSPYHRVEAVVDYPAVMFVTGDADDRCNPIHVRKMAARLQARPAQHSPVIVDYSEERGHSPVLPLSVRTAALARRLAFLCHELEIPVDAKIGGSYVACF